jgi:hypothetical protein
MMVKLLRFMLLLMIGIVLFIISHSNHQLQANQSAPVPRPEEECLISNGGFEDGWSGWKPLWTRETGAGEIFLDSQIVHDGKYSARIEFSGMQDWSFTPEVEIPVDSDAIFELSSWIKVSGDGSGTLGVIAYDANGVQDWIYAGVSPKKSTEWQYIKTKFRAPQNITKIVPRWIGERPATIWIDDFQLIRTKAPLLTNHLPDSITITNELLTITLNTQAGTLAVLDKRTSLLWQQTGLTNDLLLKDAKSDNKAIFMKLSSIT